MTAPLPPVGYRWQSAVALVATLLLLAQLIVALVAVLR